MNRNQIKQALNIIERHEAISNEAKAFMEQMYPPKNGRVSKLCYWDCRGPIEALRMEIKNSAAEILIKEMGVK